MPASNLDFEAGTMLGGPSSEEAERTILATILLDNESFFDDAAIVRVEDFAYSSHRTIFMRMSNILFGLSEGASKVDIVTLAEELRRNKELDSVGGVSFLASLTEGVPRHPVIDQYVKIVMDKSRLRKVMAICSSGISEAEDESEPSIEIIGTLQSKLAEVLDEGVSQAVSIGSVTPAVEAAVEKSRKANPTKTSLEMTWGLEEWDQFTKGCFRGEFSVLSAESSGGKTAISIQAALANAREGTPVVVFSLEMAKEVWVRRFYAAMSSILTTAHMRDPRLMNEHTHMVAMREVSKELSHLPIDIDDTNPLRVDKLKARIRMMRRKWKKERPEADKMLVIIDYLQLVKGMPKMAPQDRAENIVFTLRDIPKDEPDVHILALSQYSQGNKFQRTKTRSKDSLFWGSIVHHAAQNVFMLRVEGTEDKKPTDLLATEIRIEKQREGRRGKVDTYFDRDHLKFGNPQPPLR